MNNKEIVRLFYEYFVSEFVMRGTFSDEFLGITPTNKIIEIKGVNIDKIVDGKIVEHSQMCVSHNKANVYPLHLALNEHYCSSPLFMN